MRTWDFRSLRQVREHSNRYRGKAPNPHAIAVQGQSYPFGDLEVNALAVMMAFVADRLVYGRDRRFPLEIQIEYC